MENTREKVIEILQKYTFNKSVWDHFTDDTNLIKDLKINSSRMVDIILDIEEVFQISISDEAIERVFTIGDVIREIETLKS